MGVRIKVSNNYIHTATVDSILNKLGGNIKVPGNVCAWLIGHWKAHVSYVWHITIVYVTGIYLAVSGSFGGVQYVRNAHESQECLVHSRGSVYNDQNNVRNKF